MRHGPEEQIPHKYSTSLYGKKGVGRCQYMMTMQLSKIVLNRHLLEVVCSCLRAATIRSSVYGHVTDDQNGY
jgi:sigma54-dependent transcription regulator